MKGSSAPLRVAVLGGGNGIPNVLRGLADESRAGRKLAITAIVATADDGGSSGRIRRERGGVPPGDLRNCLLALGDAAGEPWGALFAHRYAGAGALAGHSLGNLMLMALAERTGSWVDAVAEAGRYLGARGRVIPATPVGLALEAETVHGERISGESRIGAAPSAIRRVWFEPPDPAPSDGVVDALSQADLIVLGPGSLFTSLLPVLLIHGVADAIRRSSALRVLVGNLMTQPGETIGMSLAEHLEALDRHAGPGLLDVVLLHAGTIDEARLRPYREQGAELVPGGGLSSRRETALSVLLVNDSGKIRHEPARLADALLRLSEAPRPVSSRAAATTVFPRGGPAVP
jgi:uncharacterized cofD-like protein